MNRRLLALIISAFCVFRGANRYTFKAIFDRDLLDPRLRDHLRQMIGDLVVAHVTARRTPGGSAA
jgi:hypothetical protein